MFKQCSNEKLRGLFVLRKNAFRLKTCKHFVLRIIKSYQKILAGEGFRISESRPCIEIVSQIRHAEPIGLKGDYHPLAKMPLAKHPFGWDEKR